jgi:hypothetical protein
MRCKIFGAAMTLAQLSRIANPITVLVAAGFAAGIAGSSHAAGRVAVFEFELKHGDLVPG